jgi:hypothetical protein
MRWRRNLLVIHFIAVCLFFCHHQLTARAAQLNGYMGESDWQSVDFSGCNAVAVAEVPGSPNLFVGRRLIRGDGRMAGWNGAPDDCSGGSRQFLSEDLFNQWGLVLLRFNWSNRKFAIVKPLIDTSRTKIVDRQQRGRFTCCHNRSLGEMAGLVIKSAYDPDMVNFEGKDILVFECTVLDSPVSKKFHIVGTSTCSSIFDPRENMVDASHTKVLISGRLAADGTFQSASVPHLLVFNNRLYLYWSAVTVMHGRFSKVEVYGTELELVGNDLRVKGSAAAPVNSVEPPLTVPVWVPNSKDPMSNSTIDIRYLWQHGNSVIAMAAAGGDGCVDEGGASPGCFRIVLVQSPNPLGKGIFNRGKPIPASELPTNPQAYARPIKGPKGGFWIIGDFYRPKPNGYSNLRPVPPAGFWSSRPAATAAGLMFPINDARILPTNGF